MYLFIETTSINGKICTQMYDHILSENSAFDNFLQ